MIKSVTESSRPVRHRKLPMFSADCYDCVQLQHPLNSVSTVKCISTADVSPRAYGTLTSLPGCTTSNGFLDPYPQHACAIELITFVPGDQPRLPETVRILAVLMRKNGGQGEIRTLTLFPAQHFECCVAAITPPGHSGTPFGVPFSTADSAGSLAVVIPLHAGKLLLLRLLFLGLCCFFFHRSVYLLLCFRMIDRPLFQVKHLVHHASRTV